MEAGRAERPSTSFPTPETERPDVTRAGRIVLWVVVVAVAVVVLFTWVFPWVESRTQDPAIGMPDPGDVVTAAQVARVPR
jgi:hypothetical protein